MSTTLPKSRVADSALADGGIGIVAASEYVRDLGTDDAVTLANDLEAHYRAHTALRARVQALIPIGE
jgi:hypothetical protein